MFYQKIAKTKYACMQNTGDNKEKLVKFMNDNSIDHSFGVHGELFVDDHYKLWVGNWIIAEAHENEDGVFIGFDIMTDEQFKREFAEWKED